VSSPSALFPSGHDESASLTVTALRESPRAPGRYLVTLSDGRALAVGVAALSDTGATCIGARLAPEAVARLVREAAISTLVCSAVGLLARGRKTRRELELRLKRKESDVTLVSIALERLEAAGVLSDTEVARAEASSRLRRGVAPARVRQTLRSKGITGRDADAAVADAMQDDGFDELAACRAAAGKRMRAFAALEPAVARRRLIGFLQRRGFGGSTMRTVITELLNSRGDP